MNKKRVIIIAICLILLIAIIGMIMYINLNKLPTEPLMKEDAMELINKVNKRKNIHIKISRQSDDDSENGNIIEYYKKNNKIIYIKKTKLNEEIIWENLSNGENIKKFPKINMYKKDSELNKDNWIYTGFVDLSDKNVSYQFIQYEDYKNSKCAVVEFKQEEIYKMADEEIIKESIDRIWIDLKTGVILKLEASYKSTIAGQIQENVQYIDYTEVSFDKVKNKDVVKPDVDGYIEYQEYINKKDENNMNVVENQIYQYIIDNNTNI